MQITYSCYLFETQTSYSGIHDAESRSSKGVDKWSPDELNKFKLTPETVLLLERLFMNLGVLGGVINFPLATYSIIISRLSRESVVYMYNPAGRLLVTGMR